jgi:hypothetical protein
LPGSGLRGLSFLQEALRPTLVPSTFTFAALACCVLLALASPPARAAPDDRPWAENVPEAQQSVALQLYQEGNKLFEESQHAAALSKYREALQRWDHPAIRFNAAVALVLLDQPLAAHENLERALRYGQAPFSADTYQQALTYQKLLRGQLSRVSVECAEADAEVTLDGTLMFVGPGRAERWLAPGAHQVMARKAGTLPDMRSLNLVPGKSTRESLALQEIRALPVKTARRWPTWKPWAVMGTGALVALVGAPFMISAKNDFDSFDANVADAVGAGKCKTSTGCNESDLPQAAFDSLHRGDVKNVVAVSLFSVGGAIAATGVALLILNQPRPVLPDEKSLHAWVTPIVGPGLAGLSLSLR